MPIEFYMVPVVGTGEVGDEYRAKYAWHQNAPRSCMQMMSTKDECVLMLDALASLHAAVAADPECDRICDKGQLDDQLTGTERTDLSTMLESRSIPAQWVVPGVTFRQFIRKVVGMFWLNKMITQRTYWQPMLDGLHGWLERGGLSDVPGRSSEPLAQSRKELNRQGKILKATPANSLPAEARGFIAAVKTQQGWTDQELGITPANTVQDTMKAMSAQPRGIKRRLQRHSLTLDSQWGDLPDDFRNELHAGVQAFQRDPVALGFTGTTTLRDMLTTFADEVLTEPVDFNGVIV